MKELEQIRDLTVWHWNATQWLVIATDNLVGIGEQAHDDFTATAEEVGYFTARVALFELLAAGATPELLINTVGIGGKYKERMTWGIREALREARLPHDFPITGSTETNLVPSTTALGITIIGQVTSDGFRPGTAVLHDEVWLFGIPKSAPNDPVFRTDTTSISFDQLHHLRTIPAVREILPVGSHGAEYEAEQLAITANLRFTRRSVDKEEWMKKSGGPATAALVVGALSEHPEWRILSSQIPCTFLGRLEGYR